jgi:hypothetical protein
MDMQSAMSGYDSAAAPGLVPGLDPGVAANVLETAVTSSWDEVARLAAIAAMDLPQLFSGTRHRRRAGEARRAGRRHASRPALCDFPRSFAAMTGRNRRSPRSCWDQETRPHSVFAKNNCFRKTEINATVKLHHPFD